jgi:hypothetical protein
MAGPSRGKSHEFWLTEESRIKWLENMALIFLKAASKLRDVEFLFDVHIIHFDPNGWTIQHPVRERIAGDLLDCHTNRFDYTAFADYRGYYVLNDDGSLRATIDEEDMERLNG